MTTDSTDKSIYPKINGHEVEQISNEELKKEISELKEKNTKLEEERLQDKKRIKELESLLEKNNR
jgi:hypothetical protein